MPCDISKVIFLTKHRMLGSFLFYSFAFCRLIFAFYSSGVAAPSWRDILQQIPCLRFWALVLPN